MDEYIGMIKLCGATYVPKGWLLCDGSLLSIQQYTTLFALLGTQYGGNGQTTFGLPDLCGRAAMGKDTTTKNGMMSGAEKVTLNTNQLPLHQHSAMVSSAEATTSNPTSGTIAAPNYPVGRATEPSNGYINGVATGPLGAQALGMTGGGGAHNNMQPFLALQYIICVDGTFPPRP